MYRIKQFILWVLRLYAHSFYKNKKVYLFSGLRRSGNHACINWILNSLYGEEIKLNKNGRISQSEDHKTLLLHEVNTLSPFDFINLLRTNKKAIKRADNILVSLEDYLLQGVDLFVPSGAIRIQIKRNTLALISSRVFYNINRAKQGIDRGDMSINGNFFRIIRSINEDESAWSYDEWLVNKEWRNEFLTKLGLEKDLFPRMSTEGGGSSFHGQNKNAATKMSESERWNSIKWPQRILGLLSENEDLLLKEERRFLLTTQQSRAKCRTVTSFPPKPRALLVQET